jgi:NDP-sugar pyrophosphorylase family protein
VPDRYWTDTRPHAKYRQVHRDITDGRLAAAPLADGTRTWMAPDVRIEEGASVEGPCFLDEGVVVKAGARIGPYTVVGRQTQIEEGAILEGAIVWPNCRISREAAVYNAIVGRNCHLGRSVSLDHGAVLGDRTTLTDFTRA